MEMIHTLYIFQLGQLLEKIYNLSLHYGNFIKYDRKLEVLVL